MMASDVAAADVGVQVRGQLSFDGEESFLTGVVESTDGTLIQLHGHVSRQLRQAKFDRSGFIVLDGGGGGGGRCGYG